MAPIYVFECRIRKHRYEGLRSLHHTGHEVCEECKKEGRGMSLAYRVMSGGSIHIPLRAAARDFAAETFRFAEVETRKAESKARKVQPLR